MAIRAFTGLELAERIEAALPGAVTETRHDAVWVQPPRIAEVCRWLRDDADLAFDFLSSVSGVDFIEYFDVVYHLTSMSRQHTAIVRAKVYGRENPALPSVYAVWRGADLQEREIWDLLGVRFEGHPNLKRLMLWEGFPGHPLRQDYL